MKQDLFDSLNILKQCRKYRLSPWQCPQFLFLILGVIVIISSLAIYFIGIRYSNDPQIVALIVLVVTVFLIIIDFFITKSFENLAQVARMKSEFVSIVSHQLRAPLANLKWTIDLLLSGKLEQVSEKQMAYLLILKENSQRMEKLVSDLLIVSRIDSNEFPPKLQRGSLTELAKATIARMAPLAQASNIEVRLSVIENLPDAVFDSAQISQVIDNLLDNALHYAKNKGRVEVIITQKGDNLCLGVKDDGIGISQSEQPYIFQKFFRGEHALKAQAQGSGLGLYIAKSIIDKSGGRIGFRSKEGEGTTFWFTIPIK
jgi:signal transduction histidine kinase